jgi:hypothetical protein
MATKKVERETGCFARAGEDEPLFVLRAQDRCAPATVRDWAGRAFNLGASEEKVREAMDLALLMEQWQREHGFKTPD